MAQEKLLDAYRAAWQRHEDAAKERGRLGGIVMEARKHLLAGTGGTPEALAKAYAIACENSQKFKQGEYLTAYKELKSLEKKMCEYPH